jgi:hypothetical protein
MEQVVNGIPLVVLVIALVEWIKRFGISGQALNALSMGVGAVIGVGYWYAQHPLASFGDWFGAIIYGLALGLVASGVYDAAKSVMKG